MPKVIIIGAGGAGLTALSAMLSRGFDAIIVEKSADIGGVWLDTHYPNLRIHSKSFNYCFIDFHALKSKQDKATGAEVLAYMKEYAEDKKLYSHIHFNVHVNKIIRKKDKKCVVYARDSVRHEELQFECDIVICATGFINSGMPHVPYFENKELFQGVLAHSSQFNQAMLDDILSNRKKVIVLGAGKSAHNILVLLRKVKENVLWLYAKSLWSFSFEKLYQHKNKFSWYRLKLLYAYYLVLLKWRRRFPRYTAIMRWLQKSLVNTLFLNPLEESVDIFQNRRAIMEKEEFQYLRTIKNNKSTIHSLSARSVTLSNGQRVKADYIICATGYDRVAHLPQIFIEKENGATENYDPTARNFMYNILDLDMPEIAFFMTDGVHPQQILSFSIAGQWLARFYQGTLQGVEKSFARCAKIMAKNRFKWHVPHRYLSNGAAYPHDKNNDHMLSFMLHDLELDKKWSKALWYSLNKETFDSVILKMREKLALK